MIDKALELLRKEVNDFIDRKVGGSAGENRVVLTSFVDDTGRITIPENTVGLSLINIEEERYLRTTGLMQVEKSEMMSRFMRPPVNVNLQIMFAAHFTQYPESLKHISYIISCFQTKPVFDVDNTPAMSATEIEKLLVDLNPINLEQLHYIWGMIGARYMPSTIFKVRMLALQEKDIALEVPNIQVIATAINKKEVED